MAPESYYIPEKTELCSGTYIFNTSRIIPPLEISEHKLSIIAASTFLLGVQAVLLNLYVLGYYKGKREGVFPLYYFITTLCNGILGVDAILHTILLLFYVIYSPVDTPASQKLFNYLIFIIYTLTSTARNSKLVYNTILISMRAMKYCSPSYMFSKKTSTAVILLFPIAWMLFLAGSLQIQFALPAEVNMQQYVYFPEPNSTHESKVGSMSLLYILPLSIIIFSLGVCVYKRKQKHSTDYISKLRAEQMNRSVVKQPSYGQSKATDVALTALLLSCYLPYVVLLLADVIIPQQGQKPRFVNCTLLFVTGVVLPFINSAFDPVIFIYYNSEMWVRLSLRLRALTNTCCRSTCCNCCSYTKHGVRFEYHVTDDVLIMTGGRCGSAGKRRGASGDVRRERDSSLNKMKRRDEPDVIEYKDSDVESDSSLESFEYKAKKHKSRRYR